MAEWVAGRGTEALGIIGTVLGGAALANGGVGNLLGGIFGGGGKQAADSATMAALGAAIPALVQSANNAGTLAAERKISASEIELIRENYEKDMKIAELTSNSATDGKILDLYKWIETQLKGIREGESQKWTEQAVFNATTTNGITALGGQVAAISAAVGEITKTVVPRSVICNTGCNQCCGNADV